LDFLKESELMRRCFVLLRAAMAVAVGAVTVIGSASLASADSFGSFGSFGSTGSSGGFASSGGSSGGVGPVRGLLGRIHNRLHGGIARVRTSHASSGGFGGGFHHGGGSFGSHGSSGGSWGGSSGGYVVMGGSSGGSFGSGGSSGYSTLSPTIRQRPYLIDDGYWRDGVELDSMEAPSGGPGADGLADPTGQQSTRRSSLRDDFSTQVRASQAGQWQGLNQRVRSVSAGRTGSATLTLNVPDDAVVYVNDHQMKTQGSQRRFVARNLSFDRPNTYEIRVVSQQDGEVVSQTKVVDLVPEQLSQLAFDFNREVAPVTSLTLRVPADAKVKLAGVQTDSDGELRYFHTTTLNDGEVWDDYTIEVQWEEEGRTVVKQETVQLRAGQPMQMAFGPDATAAKVAAK